MIKVAIIILHNKENKVLFMERDDDAPTYPSKWGVFGGAIENEETPVEAVKRECMEELSYELKNPRLVYEGKFCEAYGYVFSEAFDSSKDLILGEGKSMGWFTLDEIKKKNTIPFSFEIFFKN